MVENVKLNPNLRPPGGFKFRDNDDVMHVGTSVAALVRSVQGYRQRTGRPIGNPEQEILHQICSKHPRICIGYTPAFNEKAFLAQVSIRASAALHAKIPFHEISPELVAERAKICGGCRMRKSWSSLCKPCQTSIGKVVEHATADAPAKIPSLKGEGCLAALCDLQIATLTPEHRRPHDAPEHCWMGIDHPLIP